MCKLSLTESNKTEFEMVRKDSKRFVVSTNIGNARILICHCWKAFICSFIVFFITLVSIIATSWLKLRRSFRMTFWKKKPLALSIVTAYGIRSNRFFSHLFNTQLDILHDAPTTLKRTLTYRCNSSAEQFSWTFSLGKPVHFLTSRSFPSEREIDYMRSH